MFSSDHHHHQFDMPTNEILLFKWTLGNIFCLMKKICLLLWKMVPLGDCLMLKKTKLWTSISCLNGKTHFLKGFILKFEPLRGFSEVFKKILWWTDFLEDFKNYLKNIDFWAIKWPLVHIFVGQDPIYAQNWKIIRVCEIPFFDSRIPSPRFFKFW